jgi:hypothetical protein
VKKRLDRPEDPDIELTADVKARELRFEEGPETEVRFPGHPERESVSGTERGNLPEEVEPGVTYRNPRVRLRIASALADVDPELRVRLDEERRESRSKPSEEEK